MCSRRLSLPVQERTMARIKIDEGELLMALDSGDGAEQWYLDRQTGELIFRSDDFYSLDDDLDDEDEEEEGWQRDEKVLRRAIDRDEEGRYLQVPSLGSHEGFRIMEDFAASLEHGRARGALFNALDRRRPFRSFKDAL